MRLKCYSFLLHFHTNSNKAMARAWNEEDAAFCRRLRSSKCAAIQDPFPCFCSLRSQSHDSSLRFFLKRNIHVFFRRKMTSHSFAARTALLTNNNRLTLQIPRNIGKKQYNYSDANIQRCDKLCSRFVVGSVRFELCKYRY